MNRRGFFGILGGATGVAVGLPKAMQPEAAKPAATCSVTTHSGMPRRFIPGLPDTDTTFAVLPYSQGPPDDYKRCE